MAKDFKIKTRAWVHVGDELVDVDTLPYEKRSELATKLTLTWFNTLYEGKAEFCVAAGPPRPPITKETDNEI